MCHQISWFHVLCSHQTDSYNIPVFCEQAVKLGYECFPPECILLPIFGACGHCKHPKNLTERGHGCMKSNPETKRQGCMHDRLDSPDSLAPLEEELEPGCDVVGDYSGISIDSVGKIDPDKEFELFDKVTFWVTLFVFPVFVLGFFGRLCCRNRRKDKWSWRWHVGLYQR